MNSKTMAKNDNQVQNKEYCFFKRVLGIDRILKGQSFPSTQQDLTLYSLPFPKKGQGSCNIVIMGQPGTGKSTLALEMAMGFRVIQDPPTPSDSGGKDIKVDKKSATVIYFSLEQDRDSLIKRAHEIDLTKNEKENMDIRAICIKGPQSPVDEKYLKKLYKDNLELYKTNKKEKSTKKDDNTANQNKSNQPDKSMNLVLMPILSPRPLEQIGTLGEETSHEPSIFWKRLGEIRKLVEKLEKHCNGEQIPKLRMVIIDSLNVFGDKPITRYLIDQLFSFFSDRGLIGVFIAEDCELSNIEHREEPNLSPGIVNLADVVIRMSWKDEEGYTFRNIEIVKSRNTANVYGPQQMKIRDKGIEVYPSLHSWYTYLHPSEDKSQIQVKNKLLRDKDKLKNFFDSLSGNQNNIWKNLTPIDFDSIPSLIYLVSGPKETGKSTLALHFAATGVSPSSESSHAERYLLVNFDEPLLSVKKLMEEGSFYYNINEDEKSDKDHKSIKKDYDPLKGILSKSKGHIKSIKLEKDGNSYRGYELWLTPGYLLPEEFVYFLYQLLRSKEHKRITRVVLRDIGELPMRHPILAKQILSGGSNYIPVLLELFKQLGVDCMFVCTVDKDKDSKAIERGLSTIAHFRIDTEKPKNAKEQDQQSSEKSNGSEKTYRLMGRFVKEPQKLVLKLT